MLVLLNKVLPSLFIRISVLEFTSLLPQKRKEKTKSQEIKYSLVGRHLSEVAIEVQRLFHSPKEQVSIFKNILIWMFRRTITSVVDILYSFEEIKNHHI